MLVRRLVVFNCGGCRVGDGISDCVAGVVVSSGGVGWCGSVMGDVVMGDSAAGEGGGWMVVGGVIVVGELTGFGSCLCAATGGGLHTEMPCILGGMAFWRGSQRSMGRSLRRTILKVLRLGWLQVL